MKKIPLFLILIAVAGILIIGAVSLYNGLVTKNESVTKAWQDVESDYQRRMDLIPNLVNTVKGYADFEKSTLQAVVDARSNASKVTFKADGLSPENIKKFQDAQNELSSSLSRLLVTVERYPDLKANQNFLDLQTELTGTENRIKVARNKFNEAVRIYNTSCKSFPGNLVSGMFGFQPRDYFQADAAAAKAPEVKF